MDDATQFMLELVGKERFWDAYATVAEEYGLPVRDEWWGEVEGAELRRDGAEGLPSEQSNVVPAVSFR